MQLSASAQFIQPPREKPPPRLLARKRERAFVLSAGLLRSSQPPTQFAAGRMRRRVIDQLAARQNGIDQIQTRRGTVTHRDRDGAVQFDDRRWPLDAPQRIVQSDNLSPIGCRCVGRVRMDRRDGRLQRIWTERREDMARATSCSPSAIRSLSHSAGS